MLTDNSGRPGEYRVFDSSSNNQIYYVVSGDSPALNNDKQTVDIHEVTTGSWVFSVVSYYTEEDITELAKLLFHECYAVDSTTEQACVAWTVVNRCDAWGMTIHDVITEPYQYAYYEDAPVMSDMLWLAQDVLNRWSIEKTGEKDVGRVLPSSYLYFIGDEIHNYFTEEYNGTNYWDYSMESPY